MIIRGPGDKVCVRVKTCGCSRRNFIEVVLGTPADPLDGVFQQWDLRAGKLSVSGLSVPLRSARCIGSGICPWQQDSKDPTCGVYAFAQYNRDPSEANKLLVVRSKVVTRTASGNSDIEEIIDSILIEKQKNESFESLCEVNGRTFYWSVVNKKTRTIVGTIVDENGFRQMSFKYSAYPCSP